MSLHFHVIYDDFFETIQGHMLTKDVTIKWKKLSVFSREGIEDQFSKHDVIVNMKRMIDGLENKYTRRNIQRTVSIQPIFPQEDFF